MFEEGDMSNLFEQSKDCNLDDWVVVWLNIITLVKVKFM